MNVTFADELIIQKLTSMKTILMSKQVKFKPNAIAKESR